MSLDPSSTYPSSAVDDMADPSASTRMDADGYEHDLLHQLENDAIENIETFVGITSSSDSDSLVYKLTNSSSTSPGHLHVLTDISDVSVTAGVLNTLSGLTASSTELNILDGATLTTNELNILAGATLSTSELNILDGVTANATELNYLAGFTGTTAKLNTLTSYSSSPTDLQLLRWSDSLGTVEWFTSSSVTGETVKVSSNDDTVGYLNGKLVAGTNITLTENNDGDTETLTISSGATSGPGSTTDTAVVLWDGTDGSTLQDSGVLIDGSDNITGVTSIDIASGGLQLNSVAVTASAADLNATTNFEETISATTSEVTITTAKTLNIADNGGLKLNGTAITSTAAELNILDGISASLGDLNATENFEETISATTSEVTIATGKTLNMTDDGSLKLNSVAITSTAAEINVLDGISADVNDLNSTTDGWIAAGETWTYASSDDPTYTFTISGDLTGKYWPGMRIKLTDSGTQYFIITAVSYSDPNTTITIYGGTTYDLSTGSITNPFFSMMKAPLGFSLDPDDWTVETSSASDISVSPSSGVWANPSGMTIDVPIGIWRVTYDANIQATDAGTGATQEIQSTLSTANNSETDTKWTCRFSLNLSANRANQIIQGFAHREDIMDLSTKDTFYLNLQAAGDGSLTLLVRGTDGDTVIRATCAYL